MLAAAAIAATLAAIACLNDTPVGPGATGISLELHTQIVGQTTGDPGTNQTVQIEVFYHRVDGDSVQLTTDPPSLTVAAGSTTQHALAVDIGPCLTDPKRVGALAGGCQLSVVLRLLNAGGDTLDVQTIAPPDAVTPGQTVTTPAITLHTEPPALVLSASAVTFNVAAGGPTPPPDTVSVTTDRSTAHAVQATVSYTGEAQSWLSATMSADTTPAQLILTPAAPDLAPGTYMATVTVQSSASGVVPEPQTVAVAYNVAQASVASVALTPTAETIHIGDEPATLIALPKDSQGQVLSGRAVEWASSDTTVVAVSASSSMSTVEGATIDVTAGDTGSAYIRATVEGKSDSALVTVLLAPVATVTLTPAADTILAGDSTVISIAVNDVHGNVLTGRVINWATDSLSVASLGAGTDTSIIVMGERQGGPVRIIATVEGVADTSLITVLTPVSNVVVGLAGDSVVQVGGAVTTGVTLTDSSENVLTGRPVTWTSTTTAVATVDATTGDSASVTTHFVGTTYIKASAEGIADSVALVVAPATLPVLLGNCPIGFQFPEDVNDNDVVVGQCFDSAFSWRWTQADGEFHILTPPDSSFAGIQANAINNSGLVAVTVIEADSSQRPGIWVSNDSTVILPLLAGGRNGSAVRINDFGQVLGQSDTSAGPTQPSGPQHTFVWTPDDSGGTTGTLVDVEAFGGALAGGTSDVTAIDMNRRGDILVSKDGAYYLIEPSSRGSSTGTIVPVTGLKTAIALNNSRQIAGNVSNSILTSETFAALWENGSVTQLVMPPGGDRSRAVDIDDLGQILGRMGISQGSGDILNAFIWTNATGMVSLGTTVINAQALNNKGNAVGGDDGGQPLFWCTSAASVSACLP